MRIEEFQRLIEEIYYEKDSSRGLAGTHMWFCEEVGELTRALRRGDREELAGEFADVLAWLSTMASISGINARTAASSSRTLSTASARFARLESASRSVRVTAEVDRRSSQ